MENQIKVYKPLYFIEVDRWDFNYEKIRTSLNTEDEYIELAKAIWHSSWFVRIKTDDIDEYIQVKLIRRIYKQIIKSDLDYLIQIAPKDIAECLIASRKKVIEQGKEANMIRVWNYYLYNYKNSKDIKQGWTVETILEYLDNTR